MMITRNITWNVVRHILHDIKQLRHMCTVSSLYQDKGIWLRTLKRENMLEIENIWKSRVQADNDSRLQDHENEDRKKFYVLSMFPYPSGKLHMGHVRVYTISDTMARYHRMLGHEVIHPMGWDAFGLPAENAAKDRNLHPKEWTYRNIAMMKEQLQNLCCTFDWDRELTTCDPTYYRWTQYIFLKMYEAGLAYQAHAVVNWDPVDQTVLADEQIDEHGRSWRSGAVAEKKYLKQWFIKTTVYGKALYDGLDTVNEELWADVIALQKHWIGKATGCRFEFTIKDDMSEAVASNYLINHNRAGQVMIETTGQDNERSKKKPRTNNFFEVTVPSYTPSDFKSHFRMLPSIFEMLCTLIADKMEMSRSVPVTKKILCTIWLLANTESYRSVADRFNVSKGQLHAIVHSVCHALIGLKDQYIKWPRNDKLEEMSKDWAEKHHTHNSRFPGVVGSVDGTYIPIQGCGGQDRDAYICRKGFPAMHLQVVCDSKHRFIDVFTGYPGSVHDARVFKNSNLKRHLDSPDGKLPPQYHLLGDSAYPNCSYLLTPFRDNGHLTGKEKHYNKIHSQLRVTVEHSIGLLKCKFRRLKYLAMGNYAEIPYVIFACCILHNFLLMSNDTDGDEIDVSSFVNEESDPVNYNETFENTDRSGDVKRREISNML